MFFREKKTSKKPTLQLVEKDWKRIGVRLECPARNIDALLNP